MNCSVLDNIFQKYLNFSVKNITSNTSNYNKICPYQIMILSKFWQKWKIDTIAHVYSFYTARCRFITSCFLTGTSITTSTNTIARMQNKKRSFVNESSTYREIQLFYLPTIKQPEQQYHGARNCYELKILIFELTKCWPR